MKIEVSDTKVTITMWGKTHESDSEGVVEMFKHADEDERERLAIILFYGDIPSTEPIEWDDGAQEQLDDLLGADPYTMFY